MKKIIFVSACKTKKYKSGLAREMYVGQFSEKAYRYATKIDVEKDELVFLTPKGYLEGIQQYCIEKENLQKISKLR